VPVYTAEALILRTYKLGESDRIVVFLTRDRGKKRGVARGARRPRSRYAGALEPMTRAGVAYYERELRDLVRLNYVEPVASPLAAIGSSAASAAALGHVGYFAELIDEWSPDSHADERLFRLGAAMVDALTAGAPIDRLARYFEYWLLRLQGVYPSVSMCPACRHTLDAGAMMPPREELFVCRKCAPSNGGTELSSGAVRFLKASSRTSPERVERLTLDAGAARELETAHRRLLNAHLDKELKSVRVLRELER
jgi:DNA repair protein RecO (recombination protein O)